MLKKYHISPLLTDSLTQTFFYSLAISWLYALCSQFAIHLPFLLTPLSLQPLPVLFLSLTLGRPALYGYALYLLQGACGAPFFASLKSGLLHLAGPTGGFLIGFFVASIFLVTTRKENMSLIGLMLRIQGANILVFVCGIARLAFFVPTNNLLAQGLYPFLLGDFLIKFLAITLGYYSFIRAANLIKKY